MKGKVIKHSEMQPSYWRDGVKTVVWSADTNGAHNLMMWEQLIDVGYGAPIHWHPSEEHLTFYKGRAELYIDGEKQIVEGPATAIIPKRVKHGFKNIGPGELHVIIAMSESVFEAFYEHDPGVVWRAFEGDDGSKQRAVKLVEE